jgi:DNA-binding IclR family transcriptional regulator
MALKELAQAAAMTPPKAHPYLVSFGKLGLIAQEAASGHYGLGPLALQLGLISLQQFDPVRLASAELPALAQTIGQTVAIVVWGGRGPTVVRIEEAPSPVHVNMRHGAVMSLRGTASGRLFAAHLPRDQVLAAGEGTVFDRQFERELSLVRAIGISQAVDAAVPGISAVAAPVFTGSGIALGLTAIGPTASFDVGPGGAAALALGRCAVELSAQLGARQQLHPASLLANSDS